MTTASHGSNPGPARDIEHFVRYRGYSSAEALRCVTHYAGIAMKRELELGRPKAGFTADLLLIAGDPTAEVRLRQGAHNRLFIVKDDQFHKCVTLHSSAAR